MLTIMKNKFKDNLQKMNNNNNEQKTIRNSRIYKNPVNLKT